MLLSNITADERLIYAYEMTLIQITAMQMTGCKASGVTEMMYFWRSNVALVTQSTYSESQFIVFHFRETNVTEFSNNTLNSMYKGIKITDSTVSISNTTIKGMVQNEQSGSVIQSKLTQDGSAIRKFNMPFYHV